MLRTIVSDLCVTVAHAGISEPVRTRTVELPDSMECMRYYGKIG